MVMPRMMVFYYYDSILIVYCSKGYRPPNEEPSEYQNIPLNKIEDFGVHAKQYYSLDVTYFKSALDRRLLDSLWNKYWVNTLSSSSLLTVSFSFCLWNNNAIFDAIYGLSHGSETQCVINIG